MSNDCQMTQSSSILPVVCILPVWYFDLLLHSEITNPTGTNFQINMFVLYVGMYAVLLMDGRRDGLDESGCDVSRFYKYTDIQIPRYTNCT